MYFKLMPLNLGNQVSRAVSGAEKHRNSSKG